MVNRSLEIAQRFLKRTLAGRVPKARQPIFVFNHDDANRAIPEQGSQFRAPLIQLGRHLRPDPAHRIAFGHGVGLQVLKLSRQVVFLVGARHPGVEGDAGRCIDLFKLILPRPQRLDFICHDLLGPANGPQEIVDDPSERCMLVPFGQLPAPDSLKTV